MWALSCFRGFANRRKAINMTITHDSNNQLKDTFIGGTSSTGEQNVPFVEAVGLDSEWAESQYPVACVALGLKMNGNSTAHQVTVLWHNSTSDFWEHLTNAALNPGLIAAMVAAVNGQSPAQQVVLVPGSTFTAQATQATARFPSELLAAVSIPVHLSLVRFSTRWQGIVVPRALLLVCRAPFLSPRNANAGSSRSPPVTWDADFQSYFPRWDALSFVPAPTSLDCTWPPGALYGGSNTAGIPSWSRREAEAVLARRKRDSMVAAHLPAITVYSLNGQVVHQNPASIQYMGIRPVALPLGAFTVATPGVASAADFEIDGMENGGAGPEGDEGESSEGLGVLGHIFKYEQVKLRQMMDVVMGMGKVWQAIIRVPSSAVLRSELSYERPPVEAGGRAIEGHPEQVKVSGTLSAMSTTVVASAAVDVHDVGGGGNRGGISGGFGSHMRPPGCAQRQLLVEPLLSPDQHTHTQSPHHQPQRPSERRPINWKESQAGVSEGEGEGHSRGRPLNLLQGGEILGLQLPQHLTEGRPGQQEQQDNDGASGKQQEQKLEQQHEEPVVLARHQPVSALLDTGAASSPSAQQSSGVGGPIVGAAVSLNKSLKTDSSSSVLNTRADSNGRSMHEAPSFRLLTEQPTRERFHAHQQRLRRQATGEESQPPGMGSSATYAEVWMDTGSSNTGVWPAGPMSNMVGAMATRPEVLQGPGAPMTVGTEWCETDTDPLATSTWTVLGDPSSRGQFVSNHHFNHQTNQVTNQSCAWILPGDPPRSRGTRHATSRHDRPTSVIGGATATSAANNFVDDRDEAASAEALTANVGHVRRWGSAREPTAAAATNLGNPRHSVALRENSLARVGERLHAAVTSTATTTTATTVSVMAAAVAGTLVRDAGKIEAQLDLQEAADVSAQLTEVPQLEAGSTGGGGGAAVPSSESTTILLMSQGNGGADNALVSGTGTGTGAVRASSGASGFSRVLMFANSLRSAPFSHFVPFSTPSMTPGHMTSRTRRNSSGRQPRAASSTTAMQHEPHNQVPYKARPVTAATQQACGQDASTTGRDISALKALLRARRSTLVAAGLGASTSTATDSTGKCPPTPFRRRARSSVEISALAPPRFANSTGDRNGVEDGGDGSFTAPSTMLVTVGEAELAMALLPHSQSTVVSEAQRRPSSLGVDAASPQNGDGNLLAAAVAETDGSVHGGGEHDVWHEVSAVSALDPVTGEAVLVVTQVDVTAKVRAERHLVHVMCAERRLLLQLFPRHVLQHVVEAIPLLHSHQAASPSAAAASPFSLESLPREWLEGGDWRPVLKDCHKLATMHPQATVLFADIAGFDDICMELPPQQVLAFLNDFFAKIDNSIEPFGVHKMETIGGLFIVAGGLLREDEDGAVAVRERWDPLHSEKVFMFAKAMLNVAASTRLPARDEPVKLRIGIHTGPVMSGIVGTRVPRFVLFGDTVNTASRMQTSASPGSVHVSEDTRALLPHESWIPTGGVQIKGKGLLNTYVWVPEDHIHFIIPPAASTPESTRAEQSTVVAATTLTAANGSGTDYSGSIPGSGGIPDAAAFPTAVTSASRAGGFQLGILDTSSCTSSDIFLAQQLSFTAALPPNLARGKSRLRNDGSYL